MTIDQIAVTSGGAMLIAFIAWFFFMKRETILAAGDKAEILVNGGYSPEAITVRAGADVTLTFLRKDPSSCLEEINFPDFGIRRYLPLNERVTLTIHPKEKKTYSYSCGMNMFRGKVIAQ
jgi:plastocyanin domain-containing protein